uniref:Uncharacterized protein n=2 Tax=Triticum urartu TaxID=4572 RepID=A0A8R7QT43_TRIUA
METNGTYDMHIKKWNLSKHVAFSVGWSFMWVILFGLLFAVVRSYAVYKYSLHSTARSSKTATVLKAVEDHKGSSLLYRTSVHKGNLLRFMLYMSQNRDQYEASFD